MDQSNQPGNNAKLFDRLPDGFFSPLSRKYKSVYAYALITLYHCLKIYRSRILKSDYMTMLRSNGQDIMALFNVAADQKDDGADGPAPDTVSDLSNVDKFAYVARKLMAYGWFETKKDFRSGNEYVFLPSYSIRMLELLDSLTNDLTNYMPLVHQTFSELSLEDQKEDEYMYRSLANAARNADELELSVTLLHHSIVVYNNKLTNVFSPNEALHQHFDEFKKTVGDSIYHPMKTYDSLGLYSQPVIAIMNRWLRDERILAKLSNQARLDVTGEGKSPSAAMDLVIASCNRVIDVFQRLSRNFDDIDRANAEYTEAVQRKVNYLSGSDKSMKGKLDRICSSLARELNSHPNANETNSEVFRQAMDSVEFLSVSILDSDSMLLPFQRRKRMEEDPMNLPMDDFDDMALRMDDFREKQVSSITEETILAFMKRAFGNKKQIKSTDVEIDSIDDLVLLVLALTRAEWNTYFFTMEKLKDDVVAHGYRMPEYLLTRKENA